MKILIVTAKWEQNVNKNWTLQQTATTCPNCKSTAQQHKQQPHEQQQQKQHTPHSHLDKRKMQHTDVEERGICELNATFSIIILRLFVLFCWIDMHPPKWVISVHKCNRHTHTNHCQKMIFNFSISRTPWNGFSFKISLHLQSEHSDPLHLWCTRGARISRSSSISCVPTKMAIHNMLHVRHSRRQIM